MRVRSRDRHSSRARLDWRAVGVSLLPMAPTASCFSRAVDQPATSQVQEVVVVTQSLDSLQLPGFESASADATSVSSGTFAVMWGNGEQLCLVRLREKSTKCRSARGQGPGEVTSTDGFHAFNDRIGAWDVSSRSLVTWDSALNGTQRMSQPNDQTSGQFLGGLAEGSAVVVRTESLKAVEGVHPYLETLEIWPPDRSTPRRITLAASGWYASAQLPTGNAFRSVPFSGRNLSAVRSHDLVIVDAVGCRVSSVFPVRSAAAQVPCRPRLGAREARLRSVAGDSAETAPRFLPSVRATLRVIKSAPLSDTFPSFTRVVVNRGADEIALRQAAFDGDANPNWLLLDNEFRATARLKLPRDFRILAISNDYLLLAKMDSDDELAPETLYWLDRRASARAR